MAKDAVLITGASAGIGLATAIYLAQGGFQVYATMRDLHRREQLDTEVARHNVQVEVLQLDVTDNDSIHTAVQTILQQSGGIYGLVNNAGMHIGGYFEDVSEAEMRQVFDVNLFGTMAVTRQVVPYMRMARRGRIVMMSSIGGKVATPWASPYCASKFALEGFGEALAQELRPFDVYVSIVEPGTVKTELFGRNRYRAARSLDPHSPYYVWSQRLEALSAQLAEKPASTPIDVAAMVHRALTAPRPRLRYVVGYRTRCLMTLRRYLPGESFERLWMRAMLRRIVQPDTAVE